ncbi:MAG TPA: carboxypeptidase-like regulatory domain-containing protein [Edaphobacter sp.]
MRSTIQHAFMLRRWFAVLVVAISCFARAQSQTATITGTVTDASGAPIPKAKVTVEIANGPVLQTTVDAAGRFAMSAPPGEYTLMASSWGFTVYHRTFRVMAAGTINEDVRLDVYNQLRSDEIYAFSPVELLTASLTSTLPYNPLPLLKIRAKKLTALQ